MKYVTDIYPEENGYRGKITSAENKVIYISEILSDPIAVSRNLVEHVNALLEDNPLPENISTPQLVQPINGPRVIPSELSNVSTNTLPPLEPTVKANTYVPPPRRCCGRG